MGKGMKLSLAAVLAALALAPAARAELTAETMYRPGTVVSVKLNLPESSQKKLEEEPKKYVKGTFSLAETGGAPGTEGTFSPALTVGIKLKGSLGSLRTLGEKAAFKIEFDKYVEGQTFLGLQHLTLNNMVQDNSMVHETLAYTLFGANRVAGPHTGFAYLHVNLKGKEENFGMHLNIETPDAVSLGKRFGPFAAPEHLYEGEYGADATAAAESRLEVDEGDEADRSDLERLVTAVEGAVPADFSERVAPYADLQEMVHQWAVEKYIGHWDGYAGQQSSYQPNNYYLYSSAAGVFQMLPWGTDQTWGVKLSFDGAAGALFDDCLADASCATMYRRALRELLASLPGLELDSLATGTAALLKPWQETETTTRRGADATTIHNAVEATRSFARERPAELEAFLAGQSPEPKAAHVVIAVAPAAIPVGGGSGTLTMTVTSAAADPIFGDRLSVASPDPGLSFGPVVDEGEGVYTASFSAAPGSSARTVTVTDATAGISGSATLPVEEVPPPPPADGGTGGSTAAGAGPASPSDGGATGTKAPAGALVVELKKAPGHRTTGRRPVFSFTSEQPGTTFVCRVGDAPFRPCSSPVRLPRLSAGHHVFSIAAVGPEGTRGPVRRYRVFVSIRSRTRVPD